MSITDKPATLRKIERGEGDLMTLRRFRACVHHRYFIDDDGVFVLATARCCSDILVTPSTLKKTRIPRWATHVLWFNR